MKSRNMVTASLAATLVLGSLADLPLSQKGLMETLGVGSAYASNAVLPPSVTSVKTELEKDSAGKAAVDAAFTRLQALTDAAYIQEVWTKIQKKKGAATDYPSLTNTRLLELFKKLTFTTEGLEAAIADPANRQFMLELATLAGMNGSGNDFTNADATDFTNALKDELEAQIKADLLKLTTFLTNPAEAKTFLTDVLANVLAKPELKLSVLVGKYDITAEDMMAVYTKINNEVDPNNTAQKALAAAYARTKVDFDSTTADYGRELTPQLMVWGINIASAVTWKVVEDNSKIAYNNTIKKFTTTGAYNEAITVHIEGRILDNLVYAGTITMTNTYQSSGGGSGGSSNQGEVKGPDKEKVLDQLEKNFDKIVDLVTNPIAGNGLKRAQEAVQDTIREAAKIDVSTTVKVENGVARPSLNVKKLEDVFKTVKDISKAANDKLQEAAPDAKPAKVIATLGLGTVDAKTTEIPLSKELLQKAKENGIDAIAIEVNGVTLAIDLDQLGEGTTLTIKKEDKATATRAISLKVASEVYEFNFSVDGKEVETFSKPVEVRIPMTETAGADQELLVLARVNGDGTLTFKGGSYKADKKEFVALNKSFSTYAVVENKLAFSDIASVNAWAGREIEVAAAKGIVEGRAEGAFVPEDKVTRAEFAKMVVKTFALEDTAATESFKDVSDADWFKPYVAAAVKAGLVQGRSEDSFEPYAAITRAEMATIASRALIHIREYKAAALASKSLEAFQDASDIHATLKDGVALAAEQGIIIGEEGNKFNPNNESTRAQAAVVIYRLLSK